MSSKPPQPELRIRGFTYTPRADLMPELGVAIDHAGGWVLERRTLAANALELSVEVGLMSLPDLYGALLATGVELTRDSHRAVSQRVTCGMHMRPRRGISSILLLFVEVLFLDGPAQPLDLVQRYPQTFARA